ncbi:MAG: rRNA maturation RNase YbeY [Saprospiraceae bacterium]|nr:rRNA maturation RNase YbeY [Saprospiraceae bacterium]
MKRGLIEVANSYGKQIQNINYIFCNDEYLLSINQEYLKHDDYTDIITFGYESNPIVADIYISKERTDENAKKYEVGSDIELKRVMAHGLLHLIGYKDKSSEEKEEMRKMENQALNLWERITLRTES